MTETVTVKCADPDCDLVVSRTFLDFSDRPLRQAITAAFDVIRAYLADSRSTPEVWRDNEERPAAREEKP